ncbi:hypothetical protein L208DRAFT_1310208, partial [Tricholoma matsutake]
VPDRYHESILYIGPEETRGICHRILEISDMLCFRRRVACLQPILVSFEGPEETRGLSARLQCIIVSFEGPEEMTAICAPIPLLSYVFCFFRGYSVSGNSKLFSMI